MTTTTPSSETNRILDGLKRILLAKKSQFEARGEKREFLNLLEYVLTLSREKPPIISMEDSPSPDNTEPSGRRKEAQGRKVEETTEQPPSPPSPKTLESEADQILNRWIELVESCKILEEFDVLATIGKAIFIAAQMGRDNFREFSAARRKELADFRERFLSPGCTCPASD